MNFKEIKEKDKKYVMNTYNRYDLALKEGKGCKVIDFEGKEYIDFGSGIGVNSIGYANEKWVEAVSKQATCLAHSSNYFYNQPSGELAEKICTRINAKKVFFANSGAEANEGAIKTARKYSSDKYGNERYEIITLVNSFHGRTITTLSSTGQDSFHKNFIPFTKGFVYAQANSIESMTKAITNKTCAVLIELCQGEGGVIALNKEYVKQVAQLCNEKDLLLIVDEVQSGVGRSGTFLTYEQYDIQPDIVTLAKGLGGGLPIGAFVVFDKCEKVLGYSDHGTTFGGNPIVSAGANVVMDIVNNELCDEVIAKGNYIREKVLQMKHVKSVTGIGLMIGVELDEEINAGEIVAKCIKKGIIFLTAKTRLRMLPPLVITYEEINKGLEVLKETLGEY